MSIYEDSNVVVKPSLIEGLGVFAKRKFNKGDVVLKWNPRKLLEEEVVSIPSDQRRYVNKLDNGETVLMQIPERFVNSSSEPNTAVIGLADIAISDIGEGDEITSNYPIGDPR